MTSRRRERPSQAFRRSRRYRAAATAVGEAVRRLRLDEGWTLEKASEHMSLDFRHLQQIEAGQVNVTLATILRVVDAFDTSPFVILLPISPRGERQSSTNLKYKRGAPVRAPALRAKEMGRGRGRPRRFSAYLPNPIPEPTTAAVVQRQVGRAIARFRQGAMTQAQLAKKIGVSIQYVQKVEAGKQNLTISSIVKFANTLGVEPENLFTLGKRESISQ